MCFFLSSRSEKHDVHDEADFGDFPLNTQFAQATPTQQQQTTALIILGMIGAEFNTETKSMSPHNKRSRSSVKSLPPHLTDFFELLDPTIARQTAKSRVNGSCFIFGSYVDLLDLAIHSHNTPPSTPPTTPPASSSVLGEEDTSSCR